MIINFIIYNVINIFQSGRSVLDDLFTDLRDGTHLLSLLEVLSGLSLVSTLAR